MSTNPFRQIKFQQQHEPERPVIPPIQSRAPDDSGSSTERYDLSLNTNGTLLRLQFPVTTNLVVQCILLSMGIDM